MRDLLPVRIGFDEHCHSAPGDGAGDKITSVGGGTTAGHEQVGGAHAARVELYAAELAIGGSGQLDFALQQLGQRNVWRHCARAVQGRPPGRPCTMLSSSAGGGSASGGT